MMINQQYLDEQLRSLKQSYHNCHPYPHIAIDHFLTQKSAQTIHENFPLVTDNVWTHYVHFNEKKHGLTKKEFLPKSVQQLIDEMSQPQFIKWLEALTGIENLIPDPDLEGSGLHQTLKNGFLNIHADFTAHPKRSNWQRRVNVLIYFNKDWKPEWEGALELWDQQMESCVKKISPDFNRAAIFSTGRETYHGSPTPLKCPDHESRKSIAMYYYTHSTAFDKKSTIYKPRPNEHQKKVFFWFDNFLISSYSQLKNIFGLDDAIISRILQFFNKK